jgi:EAL domain-containing protein (putative c-di-GMP-specific phosphodiesterase class I)
LISETSWKSIRSEEIMKKSIRLFLVVPTLALLIVAVGYLSFKVIEQRIIEENEMLAHSMAQTLLPALLAGDSQQVQRLLKTLESYPGIQSADLISGAGESLATYVRDGVVLDAGQAQFALASADDAPHHNQLQVMAPLTFDTQILANLHMVVNLWPAYLRLIQWVGILLIMPSVIYGLVKHLRLQIRIEKTLRESSSNAGEFNLDHALHIALKDFDISVEYQPIQRVFDHGIYGAEVVICWKHPSGQTLHISPADFIALAEVEGLFLPFGAWVLKGACQQMARWHHQYGPLVLSLNLSPSQLTDPHFGETVRQICASSQYPHQLIEFEINEVTLVHQPDASASTKTFAQQGMSLTLDGFGLSPQSQDLVAQISVKKVKFSPQLIKNIAHDEQMCAFVESLAQVVQAADLQIMADGIHNAAQAEKITQMGCVLVQGPLFSQPLSSSEFDSLLATQAPVFASKTLSVTPAL